MLPCLDTLMADAERGYPYDGAKEHYVLDIDNAELVWEVVAALLPVTEREAQLEMMRGVVS
jgi:hypothetical protein